MGGFSSPSTALGAGTGILWGSPGRSSRELFLCPLISSPARGRLQSPDRTWIRSGGWLPRGFVWAGGSRSVCADGIFLFSRAFLKRESVRPPALNLLWAGAAAGNRWEAGRALWRERSCNGAQHPPVPSCPSPASAVPPCPGVGCCTNSPSPGRTAAAPPGMCPQRFGILGEHLGSTSPARGAAAASP